MSKYKHRKIIVLNAMKHRKRISNSPCTESTSNFKPKLNIESPYTQFPQSNTKDQGLQCDDFSFSSCEIPVFKISKTKKKWERPPAKEFCKSAENLIRSLERIKDIDANLNLFLKSRNYMKLNEK